MQLLDFSSLTEEKAVKVQAATDSKKDRFGGLSHNTPTATKYLLDRLSQETTNYKPLSLQDDNAFDVNISPIKESPIEAAVRGGSEAVQGMVGLAYGLGAGAGAVAESVMGDGGLSTQFKEAMVKKYVENEQDMAKHARPEDSLTYSWNKAKDGDYGAMLSWATHGTGYVASQLATMLAGSGVIAGGTQAFGKKAVGQLMGSLVEREAGRIAAQTAEKTVTDAILKEATKTVAGKVGTHLGMAATGFGMETGEIMGDLAKQSVDRGTPLSAGEIGQGLTASALAGAVEYSETLLGLKALGGKLGKIPGADIAENISGFAGKAVRGAVTGAKSAAAEAVQEATQTGIERWGKGQEVTSEEGIQEIIDAAGLGALGGGPASIGGLATRSVEEQKQVEEKRVEKQRINPELSPDFEEKVKKAAETPDGVKQYSDPKSPDYNETTAINVLHKRSQQEGISHEDKIKTGNDAIKLFQGMFKERADLFSEYKKATDAEIQASPEKYAAMENKIQELNTRINDTTPLVQAIANPQTDADPRQLLKDFRNAFIKEDGTAAGSPAESIRNVFGSNSSGAFFDPESNDYVDLEESIKTYGSTLSQQEVSELQAGAKLQRSAKAVIAQASKGSGQVNTDILEGSPEGDFKGIPQHLNGITSALGTGEIKQAQERQNKLSAWAKSRENRATTFDGMYQAYKSNKEAAPEIQQAFDRINNDRLSQGYKEPYYINDKTFGLVQTMKLEAAALKDAATYGQTMIESEINKNASSVKEETTLNVQKPKTEIPVQEIKPEKSDSPELGLEETTNLFNTEMEKPFKQRDTKKLKALRERIQSLRKVEPELELEDSVPAHFEEQQVTRQKEKPSVTVSDKALKELKLYFSGYAPEDVDSISLVPHEKHKHGQGLKAIGDAFGVHVFLYNSSSKAVNMNAGVATYKDGFVFINQNTPESYLGILGHEITHQLKRKHPDLYKKLEESLTLNSKEFTKFKKSLLDNVKGTPAEAEYSKTAQEELICMFVGEQFGKQSFWDNIYNEDKSLFKQLIQIVKKVLEKAMLSTASVEKYFTDLKQAYQTVNDVIKETISREAAVNIQENKKLVDDKIPKKMNKPLNERVTSSDTKPEEVSKEDFFKINPIRVFGKVINKKKPTLFNQNIDIIEYTQKYRNQRIQGDQYKEQREGLDTFSEFLETFTSQMHKIFKPKKFYEDGRDFRWKDSLSYFIPDGESQLPEEVVQAAGLAAFEWLTTQATNFNDDDAIRKILGLRSSAVLNHEVYPLRRVGNKAIYIAKNIGREALKNLQIGFDDKAPASMEEHVMMSIGNNVLGVLEKMGLIERHFINPGTSDTVSKDKATTGLQGLANKLSYAKSVIGPIEEKDLIMSGPSKTKGQIADDFYSLAPSEENKRFASARTFIKDDLKVIFGLEKDIDEFTFEEPTVTGGQRSLTKSDALATKEQTANLENNERTAYVLSQDTYGALKAFSPDTQKLFAGYQSEEGQHISRKDSVIGSNRGIDQQFDAFNYWKNRALYEKNKLKTPFYIKAVFQANSRMRQVGTIMPQNKKIHRALFSMKAANVEIDPKKKVHTSLFMEAVGLAFGIEASKESSLQDVIDKTQAFVDSQVIQDALGILDKIQKKEKLTPTDEQIMVKAVKAGKEDLLSFKGIVEYHKFLQAQRTGKSFNTDLFMERDGLANGPFMMSLQLRLNQPDVGFLKRMMSTGLAFGTGKNRSPQDHQVDKDPYQAIGAAWDRNIKELSEKVSPNEEQKIRAIAHLLKGIDQPFDTLPEHSRKLSKNMTVGAVYGAERASTVRSLTSHILNEVIPSALEKVAQETDVSEREALKRKLHKNIVILSDMPNPYAPGSTNPLNTTLKSQAVKNIAQNIDDYYGDALFDAMNEVYGDFREAGQILNKGIGILAARYNAALRYLVNQVKGPITKEEVNQIKERLAPLLPRIQTPMGGNIVLFDFEGDDLIKVPEGKDVPTFTKTEQTFTHEEGTKRITVLRGKAKTLKKLRASGVKPIPTIIHMLDSMVANKLMGAFDPKETGILNIHDAGITGVFDSKKMSDVQNTVMMDIMENYHVADEVQKVIRETLPKFYQLFEDPQDKEMVKKILKKEYNDQRYDLKKIEYLDKQGNRKFKYVEMDVTTATNYITSEINRITPITKRNKHMVLDHVTYMNQYFDPAGGFRTSKEQAEKVAGIPITDIVKKLEPKRIEGIPGDTQSTDSGDISSVIDDTLDQKDNTMGSGRTKLDMSMDPSDYALHDSINRDTVMDVYFDLKKIGGKKDSDSHDKTLRYRIDDIIRGVIDEHSIHVRQDAYMDTAGRYNPDTKQIFIRSHSGLLNQGISMSPGEVYVHELVHAVIHEALDKHNDLRGKVSRLYDVVFKELHKKYPGEEYRVFLNDPTIDLTDPANQGEIKIAQDRYDYFFRTPDKRGKVIKNAYTGVKSDRTLSNHLDEFMTFALTNENFGNFLRGISLGNTTYANSSWGKLRGQNIQSTLLNIFQAIIDFFRGRLTGVNKKTALEEAEALAYNLAMIQSRYKTRRFEKTRQFIGYSGKLSSIGNSFVKNAFKKVFPKAENWQEGFDILVQDPSKGGELFHEIYNDIQALDQNLIKTTLQEARGMTKRLSNYYQLLARRKRVLDSTKETVARDYREVAEKLFNFRLKPHQKVALTKAGLKTDATILLDALGIARLAEVYKEEKVRQIEIQKIKDALADKSQFPDTAKYAHYYNRAALALGDFIVHSQFREGEDTGMNALLIAELAGTSSAGRVSAPAAKKVEGLIDQLASLHAIGSLSLVHRNDFVAILDEDSNGVSKTLQLHKTLKEVAKTHLFGNTSRLIIKGYTKSTLNPAVVLKYGSFEDEALMQRNGFTRSPHPLPKDPADPYRKPVYVYTSRTGRLNSLASGILSYTANKAKGTSSQALSDIIDRTTEKGLQNFNKVEAHKKAIRDLMFTQDRDPKARLSHGLVAKVNRAGDTIDYRYVMSEATKDSYLDQVNDFDIILGSMASQIVDKQITPIINEELVKRLKQTYDEEYQKNPKAFVQVGPKAENPDMVELYYMIPEKTRKVLTEVWGPAKTMYIPKDLMTLAFGYRKYSIVDAFIESPQDRSKVEKMIVSLTNKIMQDTSGDSGHGLKAINNAEQLAIELTRYAKDNIIVKSLTITLGNFGSNLVYLRMRGIPMATIFKYGWQAIKYGTKYQSDLTKANHLSIEKGLIEKENTPEAKRRLRVIENELLQLQDALNRNPVADSIDSGLMPSLVDDVDTQGQKNYFPGKIESFIESKTEKLPKPLKTAGKILFLSQDTEAYKVLNNGVKLTDFVGRHVLYNYYTQAQGMDEKEAAQKAIEEFVNFDIPSHRITEYLNEIGILWFTKYATRIPMVAAKAIIDKPFTSMMSYLMSTHIGLDNIIDSAIPNIGYKLDTPPTAWIGSTDELLTAQLLGAILP